MSKDDRAQLILDDLLSSTYAKQTITKDGTTYELRSVIRSIVITDTSCNCHSIADGPADSLTSIKELL